MAITTIAEIKKALVAAGFEVYRTRGTEVFIADRVRDNLIMDSGVSVNSGELLSVRFVVRAQRSDFPSEGPGALFELARGLGRAADGRGFSEISTNASPMNDPVDPTRTLDTWYEVAFEKAVQDLAQAIDEVQFAVGIEKTARANPPNA